MKVNFQWILPTPTWLLLRTSINREQVNILLLMGETDHNNGKIVQINKFKNFLRIIYFLI